MINAVHDAQERALRAQQICEDILKNTRNQLYLNMRFLDNALAQLYPAGDMEMSPAGSDGDLFYYQPEKLMAMFKKSREQVNRLYLHTLFHCIFCHIYPDNKVDQEYWNLACDVVVEEIIDGLYVKCVHRPVTMVRRQAEALLLEKGKVMTAQKVYRRLCSLHLAKAKIEELKREFTLDDHRKWYDSGKNKSQSQIQKKKWEDLRNKMQTEMETFSKEASKGSKSLMDQLHVENRQKYDYREFLRKFAVLKEEMKVDMDTFDYIFYNYGMNLYGNMPLIEPLETKEEQKVEDFVIVIDTSMSCQGDLVKRFLEETYSVLSETESFFRRIHVHMIQCDDRIQSDTVITDGQKLKDYMDHFTVKGQGGTDFRPPFAYVEKLQKEKKFTRLRGLIYFTDGYGIFPGKMPPYETAFVFMKDDYQDVDVPPWAIKLILDPEDLEQSQGKRR